MTRCPSGLMTASLERAFRAYSWLQRYQAFPVAGGLSDQSVSFLAFCDLVDSEIGAARKEQEEASQRISKILDRKGVR